MFQIQVDVDVDEEKIEKLYLDAIDRKVEKVDVDLVFWDTKELKRRVCMSWTMIQDTFFFDERFPKAKVGGKWFYPAKETEAFLNQWLKEKMR